ncbi:TonB-dependent receptor [Aestuariicella hydrocarbonica]|uniref:TonB-dependent receptor n=2 Tax=Pseudomaricurvus hydrocarbonicus TaxID=1470433 RepID=A0A9E5JX78_9GAMM|nr:TonB-dependent receptor [Aestuariicella hydrocarbonica]
MNCKSLLSAAIGLASLSTATTALSEETYKLEEVVVMAQKRSESLQGVSQAVTALTGDSLDTKNINSFVDLSGLAPGVNITKNEGFKTVIAIRGLGNEANQNAVANPSVSYHMDGIYVASPFAIQADFIDVDRIEVLRGPQGTLFGQNSTGGAINVISKQPDFDGISGKTDLTVGNYDLTKLRGSINVPLSDNVAMRTSVSQYRHSGFSENKLTGQELDQADNLSARTDWLFNLGESTSLRLFGQYFKEDSNGAAIKGIYDPASDPRELYQDTTAKYELESQVYGAIFEWDTGLATVKALGSWQKDDILVVRDNDRHSYAKNPEITISEFNPEINVQETQTYEINVISNEPLFGSVDWIVGAFYLDTDIDITIREELDVNGNGVLDGYPTTFPEVYSGDVGFVSDAHPSRESLSLYGQTTFHLTETLRLVTGLRYTEDDVVSEVSNFFIPTPDLIQTETDAVTGRLALEYDVNEDSMVYASYTRGFKPGGSNLTYGNSSDGSPALVDEIYADESIDAYEMGLKTEMFDGRMRANLAAFFYEYSDMQFQGTDPDVFQGGVANIPDAEITGVELELLALLGEAWTLDVKLSAMDTEITSSYEALDNVKAQPYFFGDELIRYDLREDVVGNELAKAPNLTADVTLSYETLLGDNMLFNSSLQYTYRGGFSQRIFNNAEVDRVGSYDVVNLVASLDLTSSGWGFDLMAMNLFDEEGVNSSMTDVFGVAATGVELIAPRQLMAKVRYEF